MLNKKTVITLATIAFCSLSPNAQATELNASSKVDLRSQDTRIAGFLEDFGNFIEWDVMPYVNNTVVPFVEEAAPIIGKGAGNVGVVWGVGNAITPPIHANQTRLIGTIDQGAMNAQCSQNLGSNDVRVTDIGEYYVCGFVDGSSTQYYPKDAICPTLYPGTYYKQEFGNPGCYAD